MESTDGLTRMPAGGVVLTLLAGLGLVVGCTADGPLGLSESNDGVPALSAAANPAPPKAMGEVEIVWPGGRGREIPPGEEKLAFAEFEAFPATATQPARGSFTYRVLNADLTPHREIVAIVSEAVVDVESRKAWFAGVVVSDVKICSGGSCDGHDGGDCGGGCSHDDGGCSGGGSDGGCSDGGTDGGCSGGGTDGGCSDGGTDGGCSDGGTDGGCSDGGTDGGCSDGTHDDGGCSGGGTDGGCSDGGTDGGCSDGTHDDGGCSGGGTDGGCSGGGTDGGCSGGGTDGGCSGGGTDGGCSGGGTGHGGGGIPGKDPRVDQIVLVKVHDVGTPGTNGDGITWKWFAPGTVVDLTVEPKHLCKKEIIGGNIVVHPVPGL